MLKNNKAKGKWFMDCSCCTSKKLRRKLKHSYKQNEKKQWKRQEGLK